MLEIPGQINICAILKFRNYYSKNSDCILKRSIVSWRLFFNFSGCFLLLINLYLGYFPRKEAESSYIFFVFLVQRGLNIFGSISLTKFPSFHSSIHLFLLLKIYKLTNNWSLTDNITGSSVILNLDFAHYFQMQTRYQR